MIAALRPSYLGRKTTDIVVLDFVVAGLRMDGRCMLRNVIIREIDILDPPDDVMLNIHEAGYLWIFMIL